MRHHYKLVKLLKQHVLRQSLQLQLAPQLRPKQHALLQSLLQTPQRMLQKSRKNLLKFLA
jgi:hypothetical protein